MTCIAKAQKGKTYIKFMILLFILITVSIVCVAFGSVNIEVSTTYKIIANKIVGKDIFEVTWNVGLENIIFNLRVPRIFLGMIAGAGLALVGVLMQTLTRNSLADPYILGISSGASAGATIAIVLGAFSFLGSRQIAITAGAFLGALLSSYLVFSISGMNKSYSKTKLILTGVAVSSIFTAITTFVVTFAKDDMLAKNAMFWTVGSLAGANYNYVKIGIVVLLIVFALSMIISKDLDAMLLGESVAQNIGVNTKIIIKFIMFGSTLLTGTIVAFTGVIGFVGLLVPHIGRRYVGSSHKRLIPFSLLIGAILLVVTDTVARTVLSPQEIPIGVITAFIGGPFFLWLVSKSSYQFGGK